MRIALGNDHVGFELKSIVIEVLTERNIEIVDCGTNSNERTDYPIYAEKVARLVASHEVDLGILLCGTGVGISIAANKIDGIRAVSCSEPYSAKLSREHNNSNVLAMGARVVGPELAKMILNIWLDSTFEGGRHQTRIEMIKNLEQKP